MTTSDAWLVVPAHRRVRHRREHRVADHFVDLDFGGNRRLASVDRVRPRAARSSHGWWEWAGVLRRASTAFCSMPLPLPGAGSSTSRPRCSGRAAWSAGLRPSAPTGRARSCSATSGGTCRTVGRSVSPRRSPGGWGRPYVRTAWTGRRSRWRPRSAGSADLGVIDRAVRTSTRLGSQVPDSGGSLSLRAGPRRARRFRGGAATRAASHRAPGSDTTPADLVRALVDGIAGQVVELVAALAGRRPGAAPLTSPACRRRPGPGSSAAHADVRPTSLQVPVRASPPRPYATALGVGAAARLGPLDPDLTARRPRWGRQHRGRLRPWLAGILFRRRGSRATRPRPYPPRDRRPRRSRLGGMINRKGLGDHVVVIGAGVVGAAIARELAQSHPAPGRLRRRRGRRRGGYV